MTKTIGFLVIAAVLEIGGDAAIRNGLVRSQWPWLAAGIGLLGAYGFVVNGNPAIDFGKLLGLYIAVFFVVSQVISAVAFGERPSRALLVGGALIITGGLVILVGDR
jgi:drug/metabolite transporter superfamily protein YnfA